MIEYIVVLFLIYLGLLSILLYSYHDIVSEYKTNKKAKHIIRHLYVNIIITFTIMYIVIAGLDSVPTIHRGISLIFGSLFH